MNLITIDFETYYDQTYSLSKMTTEEYIRHSFFEVIGVAVKVNDEPTKWYSGEMSDIGLWLRGFDWENSMVIAHNAVFDMSILHWHFHMKPKAIVDTLSMARAVHGSKISNALSSLAQYYELGEKGTEVIKALSIRRDMFTEAMLAAYGEYCKNDVELTYKLFHKLMPSFNFTEMKLIDLTVRMFTEPELVLDTPALSNYLVTLQIAKAELLTKVGMDRSELMSNPKLALVLESLGVTPPTKISPITGKTAPAFSKTDKEFTALLEHEDPTVQAVVAARLGVKSTQEETRTQRLIDIGHRGLMPVPLRYYAAHTGRWGGDDKVNLQNLKRGSLIRNTMLAPPGYVIIDADSSQIEARVLAWLAGQDDLVQAFANGEDVYKLTASKIYKTEPQNVIPSERFVGKTTVLGCFGADTMVLTSTGWKRIVDVQATDMLWDGESWVKHQGVVARGEKGTIRAWGVDATPDHEILTEHGWREWHEVVTNPFLSQSAFAKALSLLSIGSGTSKLLVSPQDGTPSSDAIVDGKGVLTVPTSKRAALLGAIRALKVRLTQPARSIGGTKQSSPIWSIVNDYLTALQTSLLGATQKHARCTPVTADVALLCTSLGEQTALTFCDTSLAYPVGTTLREKLIGWITIKDTNPEICGLQHVAKTEKTNDQLTPCKQKLQTYDIAYAGPNNRYTVATNAGPLIAHNCGYGMGASKFQMALANSKVMLATQECEAIIGGYRESYPRIPLLWKKAQKVLEAIVANRTIEFDKHGVLEVHGNRGIKLPNGLCLQYPGLTLTDEGFVYETKRGKQTIMNRIYGGKAVENVCQAVARCIIGEQLIAVSRKYKVVMTVHDAIACIAPEDEAEEAKEYVMQCMRKTPSWAEGLPLNCEAGYGRSYGEC
jgi:DNA polymerase I-like protein with 3'-5' exonuclease and polymerase domains